MPMRPQDVALRRRRALMHRVLGLTFANVSTCFLYECFDAWAKSKLQI